MGFMDRQYDGNRNAAQSIRQLAHSDVQPQAARMVRDGQIPDLRQSGSKSMIRIRRGDLPIKPSKPHTPSADVRELASRLGIRG